MAGPRLQLHTWMFQLSWQGPVWRPLSTASGLLHVHIAPSPSVCCPPACEVQKRIRHSLHRMTVIHIKMDSWYYPVNCEDKSIIHKNGLLHSWWHGTLHFKKIKVTKAGMKDQVLQMILSCQVQAWPIAFCGKCLQWLSYSNTISICPLCSHLVWLLVPWAH